MKAIETQYNGYRFRSRLEARWAVFFDALAVPYRYEPEGFDLGPAGLYLPDFWLSDQATWVEVKPGIPGADDLKKISAFGEQAPIAVFVGDIPNPETVDSSGPPIPDSGDSWWTGITLFGDNGQAWCECKRCGKVGIRYEARSDRLPCKRCYLCDMVARRVPVFQTINSGGVCPEHGANTAPGCPRTDGDRGHNGNSPRLLRAYAAARRARFEHGERPRL